MVEAVILLGTLAVLSPRSNAVLWLVAATRVALLVTVLIWATKSTKSGMLSDVVASASLVGVCLRVVLAVSIH